MKPYITIATLACVVAGCSLAGDGTPGEEGLTTWRIDDGLCPGAEGGCSLDVPVAGGVQVAIDSTVHCAVPERDRRTGELVTDCDLAGFGVAVSGSADTRGVNYDAVDGRLDIDVYTTTPGQVAFDILRGDTPYDRATMQVREPVGIECGRVGPGGASWDMDSLYPQGSYAVELYGADAEPDVELGCRLVDSGGSPLFSAAAIQWQIIEGTELATIDDGGLFGGSSSTGARIWVRLTRTGTIRLQAWFGTYTQIVEVVAS